jgi:hypothetical protein
LALTAAIQATLSASAGAITSFAPADIACSAIVPAFSGRPAVS